MPAPTGLSATVVSETAITVSWTAIGTGVKYTLQYDKGKETQTHSDITGTSYAVTGLTCGTAYTFKVNGVGSGWPYVATPGPTGQAQATTTGCDVPTPSLSFPQVTRTSITGQWSTYTDITYQMRYKVKATGSGAVGAAPNWSPIGNKIPGTGSAVTSVADKLNCGTAYEFQVEATGDDVHYKGGAVYSDTATQSTSLCLASAPTNVQAIPTAQTSITVSWDTQSGVSTYKLERSDGSGANWPNANAVQVAPTPAVTSHTYTNLTCGTDYRFRVSAIGDGINLDNSTYGSTSSEITASTNHYCTPQSLTVIPLPQRQARLSWEPVTKIGTNAVQYVVHIRMLASPGTPTPVPESSSSQTGTTHTIDLDSILSSGEGLADLPFAYFRVTATVAGKSYDSKEIGLVDSPIVRVNGHSSGSGEAEVQWAEPADVEAYVLRWRKLGKDKNDNPHTDAAWQLDEKSLPDSFEPNPISISTPSQTSQTIAGLDLGSLYAIQLNYRNNDGWVFSARDAYVWPSGTKPKPGKRVAGYPFVGHFASKTYTYRICKDTFPSEQDDWARLIEDALERWELATGFITMTPTHGPCTVYATPTPAPGTPTPTSALIEQPWFRELVIQDNNLNEVRMVDTAPLLQIEKGSVFELLINVDILKGCLLDPRFIACATSSPSYAGIISNPKNFPVGIITSPQGASERLASGDILFNQDVIYPPTPTPSIAPNIPARVVFNTCVHGSTPDPIDSNLSSRFLAYSAAVHEAGHALGLSGRPEPPPNLPPDDIALLNFLFELASFPYTIAHPATTGTVMNYDDITMHPEPDCAPHPLDILAIFALYQSPNESSP